MNGSIFNVCISFLHTQHGPKCVEIVFLFGWGYWIFGLGLMLLTTWLHIISFYKLTLCPFNIMFDFNLFPCL